MREANEYQIVMVTSIKNDDGANSFLFLSMKKAKI